MLSKLILEGPNRLHAEKKRGKRPQERKGSMGQHGRGSGFSGDAGVDQPWAEGFGLE